VLLGNICVTILYLVLSKESMTEYGWRLPFIASAIIGFIGLRLQRNMPGSHDFALAQSQSLIVSNPLRKAVEQHWKEIIYMAFVSLTWAAGFYLIFVWTPNYVSEQQDPPYRNAVSINTVLLAGICLALVCGGWLADRRHYSQTMQVGFIWVLLVSVPCFTMLDRYRGHWWPIVVLELVIGIGLALVGGAIEIFLVDCIDNIGLRYTAMGLAYNICQALFGGTAPLVAEALSMKNVEFVGMYLSLLAAVSGLSLYAGTKWKSKLKGLKGYQEIEQQKNT